nr:ribonuclease H-like domain-containing protein [Tanacetum cinerariifolium]
MAKTDENTTKLSTPQAPHTLSTIKLPILKKGDCDIWAIKMEHYFENTNYPIWEVIQKGNGHVQVSTDTHGQIRVLPPKTAKEILAREREREARTTLLMAIPEDHLVKFHKMTNAQEMWEAIKFRFGGNDESKKMHKYILKQQFESFSVSNSERLHKGYDRFQSLLSQPETHGTGVSTEDANQKFLRVFESDVKGSTRSSSSTQNVAFVSSDNTSSTNEVNTAYGVSTSSGHNSQREGSSSYTDELVYSFFPNLSSGPKLYHEDLEQLDEFDLEEMDLKCRKRDAGNTRHKSRDNGRRLAKQDKPEAMVTIDEEGIDWTGHAEDDTEDYALMAFNFNNSGSDTEVTSCSKECENTYAKLKNLYDNEQREQIVVDSIEIQAYTLALKKMSAKDKSGLGYRTQIHERVLSYEKEVLESVFESRPSDIEDSHVNDRFTKVKGMHAVPLPMTGIYMPPKDDFGINESKFTYGPKQSKNGESDAKTSDLASCDSNSSVETLESVPKPVESKPKAISEPKVWSDAPIIEEYESDSDDECVSKSVVE